MKWNRLKSQKDIDSLMEQFGSFKDSIITEINYVSGAFIHPGLLMYPVNAKRRVHMVFQHQAKDMPAIEISFEEIKRLNLAPTGTNRFAQIEDVWFNIVDGKIYWAQTNEFNVSKIDKDVSYNEFTWVAAKRAHWRILEGHLGNEVIYTPVK